jgi:chaperonin GroEL
MDMILPEYLGTCLKSITNDTETILKVESISDEVKEIVKTIKKDLNKNNTAPEVIRLEKRLARLSAKIATVKVGADSSIELKEKTDRVEDAICATKAAIKEGIVAGGGVALLNAAMFIKPKDKAESILLEAIKAPYHTILDNANISEAHPEKKGWGLDVITGKSVKMVKAGIIDPLLVTKAALRNAASVATTILSTDCIINNLRINEGNR